MTDFIDEITERRKQKRIINRLVYGKSCRDRLRMSFLQKHPGDKRVCERCVWNMFTGTPGGRGKVKSGWEEEPLRDFGSCCRAGSPLPDKAS